MEDLSDTFFRYAKIITKSAVKIIIFLVLAYYITPFIIDILVYFKSWILIKL